MSPQVGGEGSREPNDVARLWLARKESARGGGALVNGGGQIMPSRWRVFVLQR